MDFSDEIPGFLIESAENLSLLDSEMVKLEKDPADEALIASVFRTIHTIKGTSGFFGFTLLGSVTHVAENILGQVREKQRTMTPELVSLILRSVDAVRLILLCVEATGNEGPDDYEPLRYELNATFQSGVRPANTPAPALPVTQHTSTAQPAIPEPAARTTPDNRDNPGPAGRPKSCRR